MRKLISLLVMGMAMLSGWADDVYGPFGSDGDIAEDVQQLAPTVYDVALTIKGKAAVPGDCLAAYRTSDGALCGLGMAYDAGSGVVKCDLVLRSYKDAAIHFKAWQCSAPATEDMILDVDASCDIVAPAPGTVDTPKLTLFVLSRTFTVTFNKNGGTGTMRDQKFTEDVEQALNKCAFTKAGYSFKEWLGSDGETYQDQQIVTLFDDLSLTAQWKEVPVQPTLKIGGTSKFALSGNLQATLVGIENVKWSHFSSSDYFGAKTYVDASLPDAEKTASGFSVATMDDEDCWCGPLSDMNALYWTGWGQEFSTYATVEDMADYFRASPSLLRTWDNGPVEGEYGYDGLFRWFKTATGVNVASYTSSGSTDSTFAKSVQTLLGDGSHVIRIDLLFCPVEDTNPKWTWCNPYGVTHAVLCIGYVADGTKAAADPASLKALFIVDPDNDQQTGSGGRSAPNSVVYCPVSWNGSEYVVSGIWGQESTIFDSYTALKIYKPTPLKFIFDANGGKPAKQTVEQDSGRFWDVHALQEPVRDGYVFAGWYTAKGAGEIVDLDGTCEFASAQTFYAHWRKAFKATVKDGEVSEDGENYAASITVLSGTELRLKAAGKSGKEFSKWTVAPAADLGENYNPRDPYTSFAMPDAAVTFTANYVAAPGYVEVSAYEVNDTANDDGDPEGIEWSDDGKVWTPVGDGNGYPVKTGKSVAIQFRSTDPRWTVPAKASYPIIEGETAEIYVAATRVSVIAVEEEFEQLGASGTVAMTPKNGQVLPGKPVSLTAKPGKDTVFAYWLVDGKKVGYTATFKYAPDLDVVATAVFRLKSAVAAPVLAVDEVVPSANAMVGVGFEMSVPISDAAYPAKFAATKLPAGLKIDAASGTISGVPTKAGEAVVTISATGGPGGKAKSSITVPIVIRPLPEWAQGTFTGYALDGYEDDVGMVTFSVSAAGKVSGKVSLCGTNWTFAATSYDVSSKTDSAGAEEFAIRSELKAGKIARPLSLCVSAEPSPGDGGLCNARASEDADDAIALAIFAWRGMWKDKATAAEAKAELAKWEGVYTISFEDDGDCGCGYLSLTVGKDGNVKATGKLADGTSVSATSPLMYSGEAGYFAYFYSAPTAYKGGAFALTVSFAEPRGELGNDIGVAYWTSRNPEATDNYGNGFVRGLEFAGAYYNKLESLYGYYRSLRVDMEDAPELPFSYKETYLDENNRKVTESWIDYAVAIDGLLQQPGLTAAVNEKGAIVVAKATKPVQDKTTKEWAYDGANDGALTLSFTQATGIFKGSYTFWYDYESAYDDTTGKSTMAHTSKKVSFEGILVQGEEPNMGGFYLWDATGEYADEKTGKMKSYKYKQSFPVILTEP